jgi:molybdate transport system substrate-binding protein
MTRLKMLAAAVGLLSLGLAGSASADQTYVAVAANFTDAAKEIAMAFKATSGHEAVLSFGSTGTLYTQITQHAPFEVLLSADDERPAKAVREGFGVAGSTFTYAVGKLVLWSKTASVVTGEETLKGDTFAKLSIANPAAAPYGEAAIETLKRLDLYARLEPRIVQGNSIGQAFQFIDTGNAEVGFVALSQLAGRNEGSRWLVPENLYTPILQDAVLLKRGADSEAAKAFLAFLKGPQAKAIIERFGYGSVAE